MSLFSTMLILVLAVLGLGCGVILTLIAPEELAVGKKYFRWGKASLWIILAILGVYFVFPSYGLMLILGCCYLVLFLAEMYLYSKYWVIAEYILLGSTYVLTLNYTFAAIMFVYGLPSGTLLRCKVEVRK